MENKGILPPIQPMWNHILNVEGMLVLIQVCFKLNLNAQGFGTYKHLSVPLQKPEDRPPFSQLLSQLAEIAEAGL